MARARGRHDKRPLLGREPSRPFPTIRCRRPANPGRQRDTTRASSPLASTTCVDNVRAEVGQQVDLLFGVCGEAREAAFSRSRGAPFVLRSAATHMVLSAEERRGMETCWSCRPATEPRHCESSLLGPSCAGAEGRGRGDLESRILQPARAERLLAEGRKRARGGNPLVDNVGAYHSARVARHSGSRLRRLSHLPLAGPSPRTRPPGAKYARLRSRHPEG